MLKVKDIEIMIKEPGNLLTIKEDATAIEAAKKMSANQVGCLLVLDANDKFTGILSERDLLSKMLATSLPAESTVVKDIASTDVIVCTRDTEVVRIQHLMTKHQIRHIPILENNIPVGIISSRDIIAYLIHHNKVMKAAAEQLQILSAKLKGMYLEDLYNMMINEVPETFNADSAIMCFTQEGSSDLTVYRKGCTIAENKLAKPQEIINLSQNSWTICGEICEACEKIGGCAPRIIIPLRIHKQYSGTDNGQVNLHGFLCMCQLNQNSTEPKELQLHKASLLQEILSLHITSAQLFYNCQKARYEGETDPLTNVGTRGMLDKMLKFEHARAIRYKCPFSVALIDIDQLKRINDSEGRATGDTVLQQIGKTISRYSRKVDLVGRYSEDEFILLLPETKIDGAKILLDRLQEHIKNIPVPKIEPVTISGGITEWDGLPEDTIENILERSKTALREAKHSGGNCLVAN